MESKKNDANQIDFFDLETGVEEVGVDLECAQRALCCFRELLADYLDTIPKDAEDEHFRAMYLLRRMPDYIAVFDLATEKLGQIQNHTQGIVNAMYDLSAKQKGERQKIV